MPKDNRLCWVTTQLVLPRALAGWGLSIPIDKANQSMINPNVIKKKQKYSLQLLYVLNVFINIKQSSACRFETTVSRSIIWQFLVNARQRVPKLSHC